MRTGTERQGRRQSGKGRQWLPTARREGIVLISALVIMLVSGLLVLAIFVLTTAFNRTTLVQRGSYRDSIEMTSLVEEAKGLILALNKERGSSGQLLLRGDGGSLVSNDFYDVRSLEDLQITTVSELSRDISLSPGRNGRPRRLTLKVYDANYPVKQVKFTPSSDMPPSLYPVLSALPLEGNKWTIAEGSGSYTENDVIPQSHRNFGAYLIRVELYQGDARLRRVDMAFSQQVEQPGP
ncbi:MAG: hypothetical protein GX256_00630 [Fretibacterium sp.]|nr:hypothetical protein [Fretibacterium sp.]